MINKKERHCLKSTTEIGDCDERFVVKSGVLGMFSDFPDTCYNPEYDTRYRDSPTISRHLFSHAVLEPWTITVY